MENISLLRQISSGFRFKNLGQEFEISDQSVEKFLNAVDRLVTRLLDWSGDHPILFFLIFVLLAFWLVLGYFGRIHTARMKLEYERERLRSQIPELPLPEPPPLPKRRNRLLKQNKNVCDE
jgi:hypothetical protein